MATRSRCLPPTNSVVIQVRAISKANPGPTTRAPRQRTLASLCSRLIRAVNCSWQRRGLATPPGGGVQGEIKTTRKRLEAIAVARTDRKVREDVSGEKLPLAAEAEQLARRLDSLQTQQEILTRRRESLTLRSPIAGTVLTLDVQNLLLTRPVERGQVLFTVADTSAGWRLLADMPQDRIGQVVAAQRQSGPQLAARFRLRGDTDQTYLGHVESISTAAVLDTAGLNQESHPFEIVIAVDQRSLATARPGMGAEVRIDCGRRSLGYVWLHDIWENLYSWFVF